MIEEEAARRRTRTRKGKQNQNQSQSITNVLKLNQKNVCNQNLNVNTHTQMHVYSACLLRLCTKDDAEEPAKCTCLSRHANLGVNSLRKQPPLARNQPQQTTTTGCRHHPRTVQ